MLEGVGELVLCAAIANHIGLSEDPGRFFAGNYGRCLAREPDVLGSIHLEEKMLRGSPCLIVIAGSHDIHVGKSAHLEELFERLMRGPIRPHRDTAMGARDKNAELAVTDGSADLVEVPSRREHAIGTEYGELAFLGKARRDASRALFGDAHAEEALVTAGAALVELADCDGVGDIGAQADDLPLVAEVAERLPEALARRAHLALHTLAGVPEVVFAELGHLGLELGRCRFLVIGYDLEHLIDRHLAVEPEFLEALFHFLDRRGLAVPAGHILHEAHALALHGMRDDKGGLAFHGLGFLEGIHDLLHVMAVAFDDFPVE